jgi:hypothetical protein
MSEFKKEVELSKKDQDEFESVVSPVMKWLSENHHPHIHIVIESNCAQLFEGQKVFYSNEFLVD